MAVGFVRKKRHLVATAVAVMTSHQAAGAAVMKIKPATALKFLHNTDRAGCWQITKAENNRFDSCPAVIEEMSSMVPIRIGQVVRFRRHLPLISMGNGE